MTMNSKFRDILIIVIICFAISASQKNNLTSKFKNVRNRTENELDRALIKRSVFFSKANKTRTIITYATAAPRLNEVLNKPRFLNTQVSNLKFDAKNYLCATNEMAETCSEKTKMHKIGILNEFRRVLTFNAQSSIHENNSSNPYNVNYETRSDTYENKTKEQLICDLQNIQLKTLTPTTAPFSRMEISKWFPRRKLYEKEMFNSCAIIASAGSLTGSGLGGFIDSHDVVLRFNHAPTEGYEQDVGSKTTIRIVNSQVMTQARFSFTKSELYRGRGPLLGWDPSSQGASLSSWASDPEHDLFAAYAEYMRQDKPPASGGFYLLHPDALWQLWTYLQNRTPWLLRKNPPSSGFLGVALLLPHCRTLRVMEYIPSARLTARCHYFDQGTDPACTFGAWHPLAAEKLLALQMNEADDHEVFQRGYITLRPKTC